MAQASLESEHQDLSSTEHIRLPARHVIGRLAMAATRRTHLRPAQGVDRQLIDEFTHGLWPEYPMVRARVSAPCGCGDYGRRHSAWQGARVRVDHQHPAKYDSETFKKGLGQPVSARGRSTALSIAYKAQAFARADEGGRICAGQLKKATRSVGATSATAR